MAGFFEHHIVHDSINPKLPDQTGNGGEQHATCPEADTSMSEPPMVRPFAFEISSQGIVVPVDEQ